MMERDPGKVMTHFISQHPDLAKSLYVTMLRIRLVEEAIASRYAEGRMRCPTHLCTGQEAVAAAAGAVLKKEDKIVGTHRSHGHYIAKGGNLNRMIAEIYGKSTGCAKGKGGSMHLIDESVGFMGSSAIVGGTIPIAAGLALAEQINETGVVSCAFFGDGATEEGVFYETLNFAALRQLPVLFICENNFYSVYSPLRVRQPENRKIHEVARSLGVAVRDGDGNDVIAAYLLMREAVDAIRNGKGPQLLEFYTFRTREHCGPNDDDDLCYRQHEEVLRWKQKDPVDKMKSLLIGNRFFSSDELEDVQQALLAEIETAFLLAEQAPFPEDKEIETHVYAG